MHFASLTNRRLTLEPLEGRCLLSVTPFLLKDVNQATGDAFEATTNYYDVRTLHTPLLEFNGTAYAAADDGVHGIELWKSDGTEAGTTLVADLTSGQSSSYPTGFTELNGKLVFAATVSMQRQLFISDGTPEGTTQLPAQVASYDDSEVMLNVGGTVFFTGLGEDGYELWKTDGTAEGTTLVKDINPGGAGNSFPDQFAEMGGRLYFAADDGTHGVELWSSDGTADGTQMVKDGWAGADSSGPFELTTVGDTLYFSAYDNVYGDELWKSDGTESGTAMVKDIFPGTEPYPLGSEPRELTAFNGQLYFNGLYNWQLHLFTSDGTEEGTQIVKQIPWGISTIAQLTVVGSNLYFLGGESTTGYELWKSDGTEEGTQLVKDVRPGVESSMAFNFANVGGTLFFSADEGINGSELWTSNGTGEGTMLVRDIREGAGDSNPAGGIQFGGNLLFVADDGATGWELWQSDGTPAGTTLVKDINVGATGASGADQYVQSGGFTYFVATDSTHGVELWKTDGTRAGTALVKDIWPGSGDSNPQYLTNADGQLFFLANDGTHGQELWVSNGTESGTHLVKEFITPDQIYYTVDTAAIGGVVYFNAQDSNGNELWRSDGTADGTYMVKDIYPGGSSPSAPYQSFPLDLTVVNGQLYFSAADANHGRELWTSDGTSDGTVLVRDIAADTASAWPQLLVAVGDTLYFTANDGTNGYELWRSDGTEDGTHLVKDILSGSGSGLTESGYYSANLTNLAGTLLFAADDGTNGRELWTSDGTAEGTVLVKDIYPAANTSWLQDFVPVGDKLFFAADDGTNGKELWVSDGTGDGTAMVADLWEGSMSGSPQDLTAAGAQVYFTLAGEYPHHLWTSDGTAAGTVCLTESYPVARDFYDMGAGQGTLLFTIDEYRYDVEPWILRSKRPDGPGLYAPDASLWYLRNSATSGTADTSLGYGMPAAGWQPIVGDWDGDGIDTIGLYNPTASWFHLRNGNDTGVADVSFGFGVPGGGWRPVAGDWDGDGVDTIGLYDPNAAMFYLTNSHVTGRAEVTFDLGQPGVGGLPLAGDWNHDGFDSAGVYAPTTSHFVLQTAVGAVDFGYGPPDAGWLPFAGDWDDDGADTIGVYDPATSTFHLRNSNDTGVADASFGYGQPSTWLPVAGAWLGADGESDGAAPSLAVSGASAASAGDTASQVGNPRVYGAATMSSAIAFAGDTSSATRDDDSQDAESTSACDLTSQAVDQIDLPGIVEHELYHFEDLDELAAPPSALASGDLATPIDDALADFARPLAGRCLEVA
jgi:ELWxxDGT repeat protein